MKGLLKKFALYAAITALLLSAVTPVMAANPKDKCQITVVTSLQGGKELNSHKLLNCEGAYVGAVGLFRK
jgi:hypothetical protein